MSYQLIPLSVDNYEQIVRERGAIYRAVPIMIR